MELILCAAGIASAFYLSRLGNRAVLNLLTVKKK